MKVEIFFGLLIVCFFSLPAFAQRSAVEVRGTIVEEGTDIPVEQATIRLLNVKDSTMINGVASSRNGSFSLKSIRPGNYLLHITYVGFEPLYQPLQITGRTNPVELGNLELSDGAILLGEAVVVGKAPEMVVRNDTIEYNADSYKVTEGSVLEDLLKKMPGVEVDSEGKITVNGKEVKKVMVDGKEFFSDDPKVASKNLPAQMIDKLQVLDRKSDMTLMTGFDDGEEETVINLTVKPGMKQGWFGNAFAGYGSDERYEGNFMVNRFYNSNQFTIMGGVNNTNNMGFSDLASTMFQGMGGGGGGPRFRGGNSSGITQSGNIGTNFSKEFSQKLTLNGNIRYSHSDNELFGNSKDRKIQPGDSLQHQESESYRNRKSDNIGVNFRMEWKPDTMTNIIFRPNFSYSKSENVTSEDYVTLQGLKDTDEALMDSLNRGDSYTADNGNGYNMDARLEISRKLNSKGRVLSASFSGGYSDSDEDGTEYSNTYYYGERDAMANKLIDQQYQYNNKGYNYRAYLSWVEPLGRNNFLQATYSFSQRKQEALKYTYAKDDLGDYTRLDTAYSQSYRNDFISQRASLSFKSQREKFNYTIGFNLDPSYTKSETFIGDTILSSLSRDVLNLSPMAQFNYIYNKQTNLRIDYNGRTSQPGMTQL
ncbi:MAG: TonB-dependent receptor, partial [Tannerellaceae bacterium]|nr:TonB-dependent receptor [Tannerellaceae bacterium]